MGINLRARFGDAFVLQFWVMTKINEETKLEVAGLQVVQDLSAMLVRQLTDSFQFDDDFFVADKIGKVFLAQDPIPIFERQAWQSDCRNVRVFEFDAKAFLINRLIKSTPFVFVNLKACSNNGVAFVLEDEIWGEFLWRHLAYLADNQNFRLLMSLTSVVCRAR